MKVNKIESNSRIETSLITDLKASRDKNDFYKSLVWIEKKTNIDMLFSKFSNIPTIFNPTIAMSKICGDACVARCSDCSCKAGNCDIKSNSSLIV